MESDSVKSKDTNSNDNVVDTDNLSKRQRKRLEKRKLWELNKSARRECERAKKKQRKAEARELGVVPQGPSRNALKQSSMKNSSCHIRVVIDVGFDHLMTERDKRKMCKQIQRCYAINRRLQSPLQFYVTNLSGETEDILQKNNGYLSWDIFFRSTSYLDEFSKNEIVYLSSESSNILETLEESKVYIIGGLVDHNKQKGLCLSLAEKNGVNHARLPIEEHINMQTRKVLTINHVFQILAFRTEGTSWKDAFLNSLAQRKGATAKDTTEVSNHEQNKSDEKQALVEIQCDEATEGSHDVQANEQNNTALINCANVLELS